jgi:hypothetical protein
MHSGCYAPSKRHGSNHIHSERLGHCTQKDSGDDSAVQELLRSQGGNVVDISARFGAKPHDEGGLQKTFGQSKCK